MTGPVLRALADENEFVRETAYKAGQRLVMMYADSAITVLLPGNESSINDVTQIGDFSGPPLCPLSVLLAPSHMSQKFSTLYMRLRDVIYECSLLKYNLKDMYGIQMIACESTRIVLVRISDHTT